MTKLSPIIKKKFDKNGVIVLRNFLSINKVYELQRKIDTYYWIKWKYKSNVL